MRNAAFQRDMPGMGVRATWVMLNRGNVTYVVPQGNCSISLRCWGTYDDL